VPYIGYVDAYVFLHFNISYDIHLILPRGYPTKILDPFLISPRAREVTLKNGSFRFVANIKN